MHDWNLLHAFDGEMKLSVESVDCNLKSTQIDLNYNFIPSFIQ